MALPWQNLPRWANRLLWFINRGYMMEFFTPDNVIFGSCALGAAGILIGVGYFVMTRIANIEV